MADRGHSSFVTRRGCSSRERTALADLGQNMPVEDAARTVADTAERALCTMPSDAGPHS